jgi:hypothetical protein
VTSSPHFVPSFSSAVTWAFCSVTTSSFLLQAAKNKHKINEIKK